MNTSLETGLARVVEEQLKQAPPLKNSRAVLKMPKILGCIVVDKAMLRQELTNALNQSGERGIFQRLASLFGFRLVQVERLELIEQEGGDVFDRVIQLDDAEASGVVGKIIADLSTQEQSDLEELTAKQAALHKSTEMAGIIENKLSTATKQAQMRETNYLIGIAQVLEQIGQAPGDASAAQIKELLEATLHQQDIDLLWEPPADDLGKRFTVQRTSRPEAQGVLRPALVSGERVYVRGLVYQQVDPAEAGEAKAEEAGV